MAHGGKRKGAGAPRKNRNSVTHGLYARSIVSPEERASFDRHFKALCKDPKTALLAASALILAHAERVVREQEDGFLKIEKTDTDGNGENGPISKTTVKTVEITGPLADALQKASRIAVNAHEVEKARKEIAGAIGGASDVIIQLHPDLAEED